MLKLRWRCMSFQSLAFFYLTSSKLTTFLSTQNEAEPHMRKRFVSNLERNILPSVAKEPVLYDYQGENPSPLHSETFEAISLCISGVLNFHFDCLGECLNGKDKNDCKIVKTCSYVCSKEIPIPKHVPEPYLISNVTKASLPKISNTHLALVVECVASCGSFCSMFSSNDVRFDGVLHMEYECIDTCLNSKPQFCVSVTACQTYCGTSFMPSIINLP